MPVSEKDLLTDLRTTIDYMLLHGTQDQMRILRMGLKWLVMLAKKNQDYGAAVWQSPVLIPSLDSGDAILVRMSDKISRIVNLRETKENAQIEESIEDTMADLGAYALLWLARPK